MSDEYLFISDCHVQAGNPQIAGELIAFLKNRASNARFLYILGDLFEVWLGDDDPAAELRPVLECLHELSKNLEIFFLAGNRDFLIGERTAETSGFKRLSDPTCLTLGGERILLMHGDTLCSDDHDYQAFRETVRNPAWQSQFLNKPLADRQQIASAMRKQSKSAMANKAREIMDVNETTVAEHFREHEADVLIHGHTHRPCTHRYANNRRRIVLGDWNPYPSYLSWSNSSGFSLHDRRIE